MLSEGAEALSPSLRSRVNSAKGKHLCAHRERPFAALRVTTQLAAPGMAMDLYRETLRCAQGDNTVPMLVVKVHHRSCHAERSEASLCPSRETLSAAKGDTTVPMLIVKVHHRAGAGGGIPGEAVPHPSAINVAATPV